MELYAKVPVTKLMEQLPEFDLNLRRRLGDYIIINSTDLQLVDDGYTLEDKAEKLGGYILTTAQAKREITKYTTNNE